MRSLVIVSIDQETGQQQQVALDETEGDTPDGDLIQAINQARDLTRPPENMVQFPDLIQQNDTANQ